MRKILLSLLFLCLFSFGISAQVENKSLSQAEIDKIVNSFTNKEKEFREAFADYSYNRKAVAQRFGMGGQITGEFRRESIITVKPDGTRFEKIIFEPMSTFSEMTIEDIEDLGGVNTFALEPSHIAEYNFNYVGKEKIDELDLYVFDVSPKVMPNPKKTKLRLFQGRIWVDDRDLLIVKTKGKGVPETKNNKYPIVEMWRENVDGKYWFPSLALANDELLFDNGFTLKMKMRIKFSNYSRGKVEVKILDDDTETKPTPTPKPSPSPSPTPKKP